MKRTLTKRLVVATGAAALAFGAAACEVEGEGLDPGQELGETGLEDGGILEDTGVETEG